jgi:ABC-type amino acid transport substrate-binding protein
MQRVRSTARRGHRVRIASCAIAMLTVVTMALGAAPASAATLDQIKQTGRIRLGYRTDARPLSYRDESGRAAGYSVALCQQIADALKTELGLPQLAVEWVPVTLEDRFRAVQQGQVDLLCGAESVTLTRRAEVAFSIPTFPGGIGALVRADAPARLRQVLTGRQGGVRPVWRGTIDQSLHAGKFSAVAGTTGEQWLNSRVKEFQLAAQVTPVDSYDAGVRRVLDRTSNVLFGDRALLLDAAQRSPSPRDVIVLDRLFTYEPLALVLPRGDEDFRLVVDRTLSRLYRSGQAAALHAKWAGEPDADTLTFFRMNALPE